jgi:hypothetical protein
MGWGLEPMVLFGGGEFLALENGRFRRIAHFELVSVTGRRPGGT